VSIKLGLDWLTKPVFIHEAVTRLEDRLYWQEPKEGTFEKAFAYWGEDRAITSTL
jgi:hypothetical protein